MFSSEIGKEHTTYTSVNTTIDAVGTMREKIVKGSAVMPYVSYCILANNRPN